MYSSQYQASSIGVFKHSKMVDLRTFLLLLKKLVCILKIIMIED